MTKTEAMELIRQGGRVRRDEWRAEEYLYAKRERVYDEDDLCVGTIDEILCCHSWFEGGWVPISGNALPETLIINGVRYVKAGG